MKLLNLRRPLAISMAELMTRLNMDHARTRVEVICKHTIQSGCQMLLAVDDVDC
jgi:hypothetical protein